MLRKIIVAGVVLLHNRLDSLNSYNNSNNNNNDNNGKKISKIKIKYLIDPVTRIRNRNIGTNCYGFYLLPFFNYFFESFFSLNYFCILSSRMCCTSIVLSCTNTVAWFLHPLTKYLIWLRKNKKKKKRKQ